MKIEKINQRGIFFTYEENDSPIDGGTSVYLIVTDKKLFLCDTYMGPETMKYITDYIKENQLEHREIIIFNSHSDWDHIWGNSVFEGHMIIGHKKCRERMQLRGEYDIERYSGKYNDGNIELKLPNLTFDKKLCFADEKIEFIYAPGHTVDSAICYDRKDSVVFAGDLIEYPGPFLNHYDLHAYLRTLKFIKNLKAKIILSAHSGIVNEELLDSNIEYINKLIDRGPEKLKNKTEYTYNVKSLLICKYEKIIREKLGDKFDFKSYKKDFWNLLNVQYDDLGNEFLHIQNTKYDDLKKTFEKYLNLNRS